MTQSSPLLTVPVEIRYMVYQYLLDAGKERRITIQNKPGLPLSRNFDHFGNKRRTPYYVQGKAMDRRVYETTYALADDTDVQIHPAILAVNRKLRREASEYLYGRHSFHFGDHIEAVAPFLRDMTSPTLDLLKEITIRKRAPLRGLETDSSSWLNICKLISTLPRLRKLRLIVEGGCPTRPWDGPQMLNVSDIKLLHATRHECLDWVTGLGLLRSVEEVEICAELGFMMEPTTSPALIYAALSASIETTLVEYLRVEMGISATAGGE
ncbi:hypothetical protein VHEMI03121 [[Torrubiella] hemipterigena]|uniref:DUF7730 domain-containing protein n=1 Tax=[Torrubiella] hemipterigena TaxID=1531966 RepID=A0A0A1SRL4_9HYPO|nr:hypothetical protein VHEMI03121 [[Torrubiella] hemipterigena]